MPTAYFIFYVLAVAGAYIFKLSYLGWFGGYFLSVVVIVPLFMLLVSLPGMLRTKISISAPRILPCGSDAGLSIALRRSIIPLGRLSLQLKVKNIYTGEITEQRFHWDTLNGGTLYLPLPTDNCGRLVCELTGLRCCDMLRLISIHRKSPEPVSCVIMPPVIAPDGVRDISAELESRTILKPKPGGGYSEEHELREYRPGDMVNSIHWKLSSKTDKTIVREPLTSAEAKIYVIVSGQSRRALGNARSISLTLCELEQEHELVSSDCATVGNAQESEQAFINLLSTPRAAAQNVNTLNARCCFIVSDEGVRVK